ncbi:hypothetical protein ACIQ2D_03175 [Lysinibacillus sp. NPDC097287]|uniref:hypothetical protein n=1 Tax=Lysinibacillus sp. NPDC097287 TaxID=3364144 RepID=UPI003813952F
MRKVSFMIIGLVCIIFIISVLKKDIWEVNAELLQAEILSIGKDVETINLLEVTPFEWDKLYSFEAYTPKERVYATIGYKWAPIQETVSEGTNQFVFLKDEKVVCYVFGYPTN